MKTRHENPWDWDLRVRERNIKSGSLGLKDLEHYLSTLPDSIENVEAFMVKQQGFEPVPSELSEPAPTYVGDPGAIK